MGAYFFYTSKSFESLKQKIPLEFFSGILFIQSQK